MSFLNNAHQQTVDMTTNSLPNTICPPPLYYRNSREDGSHRQERSRDHSDTQLDLRQCRQHSTVYDPVATSLHWSALLMGAGTTNQPSPTSARPLVEVKATTSCGTCTCVTNARIPLLNAMAKEILSLDKKDGPSKVKQTDVPLEDEFEDVDKYEQQYEKRIHDRSRFVRECCDIKDDDYTVPCKIKSTPSGRTSRKSSPRVKSRSSPNSPSPSSTARSSPRRPKYNRGTRSPTDSPKIVVHMPKTTNKRGRNKPARNILSVPKDKGLTVKPPRSDPNLDSTNTRGVDEEKPLSVVTLLNELDKNLTQPLSPSILVTPELFRHAASMESRVEAKTSLDQTSTTVETMNQTRLDAMASQPLNSTTFLDQTSVKIETTTTGDQQLELTSIQVDASQLNSTFLDQANITDSVEVKATVTTSTTADFPLDSSLDQTNLQVRVSTASSPSYDSYQDQASVTVQAITVRHPAPLEKQQSHGDSTGSGDSSEVKGHLDDWKLVQLSKLSLANKSESDAEAVTTDLEEYSEYSDDFESESESTVS